MCQRKRALGLPPGQLKPATWRRGARWSAVYLYLAREARERARRVDDEHDGLARASKVVRNDS